MVTIFKGNAEQRLLQIETAEQQRVPILLKITLQAYHVHQIGECNR